MKQCLEAIKEQRSDDKTINKRRQGYHETIESTVREISKFMRKLCSKNEDTAIKDIVILAANTWTEFALQHCRLMILQPMSKENISRSKYQDQRGKLLILKPVVRRIGNSQGQQLDKDVIVRGCEGEVSKLSVK